MDNTSSQGNVQQMRLVVEAEDFQEAVAFYRDALGMEEEFFVESEGGALVMALQAGRATLEIVNPAQRRLIDELEVGSDVSRSIRVGFEVVDAVSTTDRLVTAGAELLAAPMETPWRSLNSRLEAPAGLQITLFEQLEQQGESSASGRSCPSIKANRVQTSSVSGFSSRWERHCSRRRGA